MSLQDRVNNLLANAERIYVREQVDGKWGSFALTELPADKAIEHTCRLLLRDAEPVHLLDDSEAQR